MSRPRLNTQLFALRQSPPAELVVLGRRYRLTKVFKHDFFAATALYTAAEPGDGYARLVAKFGREQDFCGLPLRWIGTLLRSREQRVHERLDGVPGVQRWAARLSESAYALEYIEGQTLDTLAGPPPVGFFDQLRTLLDAIHARQAAYCDLHKRSNILVAPDGRPGLIDFQISLLYDEHAGVIRRWVLRRWVAYLQQMDLYHLYKHKRRLARQELRPGEETLSRQRGWLANLHRTLTGPIRTLRRKFLTRQHQAGRLVSPSADLETHDQPEKATWRKG